MNSSSSSDMSKLWSLGFNLFIISCIYLRFIQCYYTSKIYRDKYLRGLATLWFCNKISTKSHHIEICACIHMSLGFTFRTCMFHFVPSGLRKPTNRTIPCKLYEIHKTFHLILFCTRGKRIILTFCPSEETNVLLTEYVNYNDTMQEIMIDFINVLKILKKITFLHYVSSPSCVRLSLITLPQIFSPASINNFERMF